MRVKMVKNILSWAGCVGLILQSSLVHAVQDVLSFVNPLIGTSNGGHVFAGATLPFGMAKAVADSGGNDDQGGFATDGHFITGFSHMHDDGTGGSPSLGNFPLFPYAGCTGDKPSGCQYAKYSRETLYKKGSVIAEPGYFSITLKSNVRGEMTVTNHTALYRFTFPSTPTESNATLNPLILLDLIDLSGSRSEGHAKVDPSTGRMTGSGNFAPSFGEGRYVLYFCADFTGAPIKSVNTWSVNSPTQPAKYNISVGGSPADAGTYIQFGQPTKNNQILSRVGVSFISTDKACSNGETEIPDFDFQTVRQAATTAWREELSTVSIQPGGASTALQTVFWSGIYRSLISPQDYTGENPLWSSPEPYYDSYYCIWDSFRSIHPLITLVDPVSQTLMVRSLINIFVHEEWLPDCRMSLDKGYTQGGSNADVVLTDAYLKNISQDVDWATGYAAVIQDAEVEPQDWNVQGRGDLQAWHGKGYIPINPIDTLGNGLQTRSVSRTVEYAYNDFCIAEMAKSMGKTQDFEKYKGRASNWKNVFKANETSAFPNGTDTGFVGFLQPKNRNGTWNHQDPTLCSPVNDFTGCYLSPGGHSTYEGSPWLYTFFVPGDMATLVQTLGGPATFTKRLDFLHDSGILYVGDEQSFLPVFQYHYAGRPGRSSYRSHTYIPSMWNTTRAGIPGNDDSGAMGSFAALAMMGLFPNPGQNVYLINPPYFESVSVTNKLTGKTATVKNTNFDPTYKKIYIQSAKLDGKPYTKNWIDHSFFLNGGTLELTLGETEGTWGTANEDLPPSLSTTGIHL